MKDQLHYQSKHYVECSSIEHYEDPNMDWRGSHEKTTKDLIKEYTKAVTGNNGYLPLHSDEFLDLLQLARSQATKRVERAIRQYDDSQKKSHQ